MGWVASRSSLQISPLTPGPKKHEPITCCCSGTASHSRLPPHRSRTLPLAHVSGAQSASMMAAERQIREPRQPCQKEHRQGGHHVITFLSF
ncbi:hypothetical protein FKM82_020738 [Ascaphus truei]